MPDKHLFLIDGSAYIFRAYHALPPLTRKSDGLPVGAVSGFCNMLWKLLSEARDTTVGIVPSHFAVIFDYSSKTFRNTLYPDYKANRSEPPEDLRPQFSLIRKATEAFGLPAIEKEGFEADDLIATYAKKAVKAGADVTIISSDKDLMQLVGKSVRMYDSMKDRQFGIDEVKQKWGVGPEKMIDLQALCGDSSDNVPGVPGIGPKTAAQLLDEFGDLETLLARAEQIPQKKRRENLIEFADQARLSKQLVTLRDDVALDIEFDGLVLEATNGAKLIAFLKAMEFSTLTRKIAAETDTDAAQIEADQISSEIWEQMRGPDLDAGSAAPQGTEAVNKTKSGAAKSPQDGAFLRPAELAGQIAQQAASAKIDTGAYETVTDIDVLEIRIEAIREKGLCAIDTETTSLDPMQAELLGVSLAVAPGKACYIPLGHVQGAGDLLGGGLVEGQLPKDAVLAALKPLLEDASILKIGQNMKYDFLVFSQHGVDLCGFDDTMLLSYVLDAGKGNHGMDELAKRWLGHQTISYKALTGTGRSAISFAEVEIEKASQYAAEDADITLRLWQVLKPRLVAEGMASVYERLERPLIDVLARMEQRGIGVDRQILAILSGDLAKAAAKGEEEIYAMAGERFNIASPKQLGEILFGKLGLPGASKTKTGQYSTSAQVLEDLAGEGHELPRKIVFWRQLTKLKSTYTDALPEFINPKTNRVHTSYAMASTSTGRLSSSDPNLQNIPIRTEEGRRIRTAFIAKKGYDLISADYSQIELRVLAHIADIPQLTKAFADGLDIHAMTASEMFTVPLEGMDPMVRRRAKAINFGIIYGISAFGLANQLGIAREEASQYIKTYFERFPGIKDYMEDTKQGARQKGYVETIFGRRIHYPDIKASNHQLRAFNERAAINAPIQGSAADIIRRAMIGIEPELQKAGLKADMLLQVHDELIFECEQSQTEAVIKTVTKVMEEAPFPALVLKVPLKVDARAAKNWDEAH